MPFSAEKGKNGYDQFYSISSLKEFSKMHDPFNATFWTGTLPLRITLNDNENTSSPLFTGLKSSDREN